MQITNHNHVKGPGDQLPPDDSVREAAIEAMRGEALVVITESVFEERMASASWVSDAQGDFSQVEYNEITVALVGGDAMKVGLLTLEATRRSIRRGAEKEASYRLDKIEHEDEADYYSAAVAV